MFAPDFLPGDPLLENYPVGWPLLVCVCVYIYGFSLIFVVWSLLGSRFSNQIKKPLELIILSIFQVAGFLNKMQLHAESHALPNGDHIFNVSVPPTRSDVLHPCDVAEVLGWLTR